MLCVYDWNGITSKKPDTVLLMQNVDLGHTKVMQIRQGETLSHQGAITHEVCCLAAELQLFKIIQALRSNTWIGSVLKALLLFTFDNDYAFFMAE